jgi:catechol 2,3-dioxygenase-like lactoylglutathione lyase family enzyme
VSKASINGLRGVEFGVADMERSIAFYENVWALSLVQRDGDAAYFRASGPEHHVVVLRPRTVPGLLRANFAAPDRAAVDELFEQISKAGGKPVAQPGAVDEPGGGYGFTFDDAEGRELRVLCGVEQHKDAALAANRPYKLSHLVINANDTDGSSAFFRNAMGFRLRDQTARMDFLGCNSDHHSVAITRSGNVSLNHVAFEVPDIDSLMRGSARVRRNGTAIEWGVGRHGPGNNVFAYFLDPNELAIEYTAEIQQVDDATYRAGKPEDWKPPIAGNPDYWGFAEVPSERFERATSGHAPAHA